MIREYDTLGAIPGVQTPDDITSAIESVREWAESNRAVFEHNKEFLKACETLERMMDEGSDFRELERHFALIQRAELPVPKTIEQRFCKSADKSHWNAHADIASTPSSPAVRLSSAPS